MATLVSPGVAVSLIDESFYIPGRQATVPLIFVATADEKTQSDGLTPALGTFENNVVRVVTSLSQSLELYGVPEFRVDSAGQPLHGDARNEYGLDALNKYLEIGNRAYVVRANVNLNDNYEDVKALWTAKISEAADDLQALVASFIQEYNQSNGLIPSSVGYKQTVTKSELKTLVNEALIPVFASYSFSSSDFQTGFLQDHTIDHAGYQDVLYDDTGGNIVGSDVTGLNNDTTLYGFEIAISDNGGSNTFVVQVAGQDAQTFSELVSEIETEIQATTGDSGTTVEIIAGRIRITSGLAGATSSVEILTDGPSGTIALFGSTNLFSAFDAPVAGRGPDPLDVFSDDFTTIVGTYDGLDSIIDAWSAGSVTATEFTSTESEGVLLAAGADYDNTLEFRNLTSLGANDAARRSEIVTALQAAINNPDTLVRSDRYNYNLALAPGYWETTDELLRLAQDQEGEVFVIADTPFDRAPTGPNGLLEWSADNKIASNLVAYYYPHGISSNIDGENIMTSAASSALRVFAVNDRDGELWYAPAGPNRGSAPHLTSIGYVSGTLGTATTWIENDIDEGTRDTLFEIDINAFSNIINRGIIVMAQNTTQGSATALDRVNVSRLAGFIRRELRQRLFDFLFEPNDELTRQNVKAVADSFLSGIVGRRGLFDFATKCDETNNTPATIDASELHVDIAIKPIKAAEFILVDLRIVRTDAVIR
jgi:hypothetical protein